MSNRFEFFFPLKKTIVLILIFTFAFSNSLSYSTPFHLLQAKEPSLARTQSFKSSSIFSKVVDEIGLQLGDKHTVLRSESRSRLNKLEINEAVRAGELAEIWGDKRVNGQTVNVEETILWLTERLAGDVADVLENWQVVESNANALIHGGMTPEQVYDFLPEGFIAERIDENGNIISATAGQIYEGGINNFLLSMGEDVPVSSFRWAMNESIPASEKSKKKGLVLTGPNDDIGMMFSAFNASRYGVSSDLEDSEDASPDFASGKIWEQQLNLKNIYAGKFQGGKYFHPKKNKEYELKVDLQEARAPFHRLPGLHLTFPSVTINGERIPAFIPIFVLYVLNNFDNLKKNGFDIGFYLPKSKWPQDMYVWNKAIFLMEERIGVPHGTIKVKVMHERAEFSLSQFVNMWVVQMSTLITNVGRWDQNSSFVQMFQLFDSMLFPDQRFAGMLTPRMNYYTLRNAFFNVLVGVTPETAATIDPEKPVQLVELTNALAEGGMAVQLKNNPKPDDPKEIADEKLRNNTNAISDITIDKIRERLIGLFLFTKSNGQKILIDSTRESWVATTDREYVRAGAEPLQVELNALESTLEGILKPLQNYVDRKVTPEMRQKFIQLGILRKDGKIKPTEFRREDLTKEKIDSPENWKRLMVPPQGERTLTGVTQEMFFIFDYVGQQLAGNNAAAVENPLDGNGWKGILNAQFTGNRLMSDHATNEGNTNGLIASIHHRQKFTQDGEFIDLTGTYPPLRVKEGDPITPNLIYQVWLRLRAFTDGRLSNFEAKKIPVNREVANLAMEVTKRILLKTTEKGSPFLKGSRQLEIQPVQVPYYSRILYSLRDLIKQGRIQESGRVLSAILNDRENVAFGVLTGKFEREDLVIHDYVHNRFENSEKVFGVARSESREPVDYKKVRKLERGRYEKWLAADQKAAEAIRKDWENNPRWKNVRRTWTPEAVVSLRGNFQVEYSIAQKGARRAWDLVQAPKRLYLAPGATTGLSAEQIVNAGHEFVYVTGWGTAADANADRKTFPDLSLLSRASIPAVVERHNRALLQADRIQKVLIGQGKIKPEQAIDYLAPVIMDLESGYGGILHTFEQTLSAIEAGASVIHIEDQDPACKKCGHMGGITVIPTALMILKVLAARLASDVAGVPIVIIVRTDSKKANWLSGNLDAADTRILKTLGFAPDSYEEAQKLILQMDEDRLLGKVEGIEGEITLEDAKSRGLESNWKVIRSPEGLYKIKSGIEVAGNRGLAYSPYGDLFWYETDDASIEEAKTFSRIALKPSGKKGVYNMSPSKNWLKQLTREQVSEYLEVLADEDFAIGIITLFEFHVKNHSIYEQARALLPKGRYEMPNFLSFAEFQSAEFRAAAEDVRANVVRHQERAGLPWWDLVLNTVMGDESVIAGYKTSSESSQFLSSEKRSELRDARKGFFDAKNASLRNQSTEQIVSRHFETRYNQNAARYQGLQDSNALPVQAQKVIHETIDDILSEPEVSLKDDTIINFESFTQQGKALNQNVNLNVTAEVKETTLILPDLTLSLISAIREITKAASQARRVTVLAKNKAEADAIRRLVNELPEFQAGRIEILNFSSPELLLTYLLSNQINRVFALGLKTGLDEGIAQKLADAFQDEKIEIRLNLFRNPEEVLSLFGLLKTAAIQHANRIATAIAA